MTAAPEVNATENPESHVLQQHPNVNEEPIIQNNGEVINDGLLADDELEVRAGKQENTGGIHEQSDSNIIRHDKEVPGNNMKSCKRSYDETKDSNAAEQQRTSKRRALHPIDNFDSRLNVTASNIENSDHKIQGSAKATDANGSLCASSIVPAVSSGSVSGRKSSVKYRKNWPRMRDSQTFKNATLSEQRSDLTKYVQELTDYTEMIEAGAIPKAFIARFFENLDTYFHNLDTTIDDLKNLNQQETVRKNQIADLMNASANDHHEMQSLLDKFESSADEKW